ncbi:unnamed protein product, partial [Effrenium voratum]
DHRLAVTAASTVADLLQAEKERGVEPHLLQVLQGSSLLDLSLPATKLCDLGITEAQELTVLCRAPRVIEEPGQSRYNDAYFCKVLEVREVGAADLALRFRVQGDGSLGDLQDSTDSRLSWGEASAHAARVNFLSLAAALFGGAEGRLCARRPAKVEEKTSADGSITIKEGTMLFTDVPTSGNVFFSFGIGGYDELKLEWPE